eukprot:TRINITY_DN145_c0_g3_i2.p1 TRINITY_DN145_c0_g3~~TRINITY_DN145_c0_g3_i2.p1  ORF type:complete len:680 (-),score=242.87 TRINITY_DN145_c0_g3_i2:186-2225(-)
MKNAALICLALWGLGADAAKVRSGIDSPSQKVVDLLKNVQDEVSREGKVEETQFTRYAEFCRQTVDDKEYAIKKNTKSISKLTAEIESLKSTSEDLDADVAKAEEEITKLETTIKEANDQRAKDKEAYDVEAKDMDQAIAAMYKAITELEGQQGNLKGNVKGALAQLSGVATKVLDTITKVNLNGVSETQAEALSKLAKPDVGKAADYNYKSGDVIQMLKDLRMTFKENRQQLDMTEMESKNAHDLKVNGLENERKLKKQEASEKTLSSAKKKERKGSAETEKTDKETAKEADEKFLEDLNVDCKEKADQHKQRSTVREGELEALAKAIDKLKKGTGASLVQGKALSFLQTSEVHEAREKALALLDKSALAHNDESLSILALKIRASSPDQGGTIELIKELITSLKEQGDAAEKKHKECEQEIEEVSTNSGTLIRKHETLVSTDEQKTAEKNEKMQLAADLTQEIAGLKKTYREATKLRTEEKAENAITLAKSKEGSEACDYAVTVLKEFYNGVGGMSFIETAHKKHKKHHKKHKTPDAIKDVAPKFTIEEGDYKGREGGIVGEVQKLKDEMDATITETEAAETKAEADYKTLSDETDASVEAKTKEMNDAKEDAEKLQVELMQIKDETQSTAEAAELAKKQLEHVQAKCDNGGVSFEQQKEARAKEIEDLESVISAIG